MNRALRNYDGHSLRATGKASWSVVIEYDEPQVAETTDATVEGWTCACGKSFSKPDEVVEHVEEVIDGE